MIGTPSGEKGRHPQRLTIVLSCIMLILLCRCTKERDVSGLWKGKMTASAEGATINADVGLMLSQMDKNVTGSMTITVKDVPWIGTGTNSKDLAGVLIGDRLSFKTGDLHFSGTVGAREIKGMIDLGPVHGTLEVMRQ